MSKLRLFILTGFLAAAVAPLYGCGSECGPGTTEQDGQCVMVAEGCGQGAILENKKCVVDTTGCGVGTTKIDGFCVPAGETCAEGTTFDQGLQVCVADTEIVCGEGTSPNDAEICIPDADACGEKTVLSDDGRCVVEAAACGEGTGLDATTGKCIVADDACGDGLALGSSGQCVATEDVCDNYTTFNPDTGLCLPDNCQENDSLVNGICMSPIEEIANSADVIEDESTTPNDPAYGGTAEPITVTTGDDEPAYFAGTIAEPTDLDGDGEVDQDVDVFTFDAVAGDWMQVTVQSNGLPAPAFVVNGPEGFERWSPLNGARDAARHIVAPADGTYTVSVMPSLVAQSGDEVGATGGELWGYVGGVHKNAAPTPVDKDISSGTVQLDGELPNLQDNFFRLTNTAATDLITLSVNSIGADSDAVVSVWADATTLHMMQPIRTGEPASFSMPASGEALILVDWTKATGPSVGFDLSATVTGSNISGTVADGANQDLPVTAELFDQIVVSQDNSANADLTVTVTDPNNVEVASRTLAPGDELPLIAFAAGDYTVSTTNDTGGAIDITLSANLIPANDLGMLTPDTPVTSNPLANSAGNKVYYTFQAPAEQVVGFYQDNAEGEEIDYKIYDTTGQVIDSNTFLDAKSDSTFGTNDYYWRYNDTAVTWLLEAEATTDLSDATVTVESITPTPLGQVTPTVTQSITNTESIDESLSGFHTVSFSETMNYYGSISPTGGEDIDVYMYDSAGAEVLYQYGGGDTSFGGRIDAGDYLIRTECDDACEGYDFEVGGMLDSEDLGRLDTPGVYTTTNMPILDDGMTYTATFTVPAGMIIEVSVENDDKDAHEANLYNSAGDVLGAETVMWPLSDTTPDSFHHFVKTEDTFTAEYIGDSSGPSANANISVRIIAPQDLGQIAEGGSVTGTETGSIVESQWFAFKVDLTTESVYAGSLTPALASEEVDARLYDSQFNLVDSWTGPYSGGSFGFGGALEQGQTGVHYVIAECDDNTCTGVDLDLALVAGEVTLGAIGDATTDASIDHTVGNFVDDQPLLLHFTVPAGKVIEISHANAENEDHNVELYDAAGNEVAADTIFEARGATSPNYLYYYAKDGGDFTAKLIGDNLTTAGEVRIRTITPDDLGQLDTAASTLTAAVTDSCLQGQSYFHTVSFTEAMKFDVLLTPGNSEDLDFYMYTDTYDEVIYEYTTAGAAVDFTGSVTNGALHVVRVECDDAANGYTLDLSNGASILEDLGLLTADSITSSTAISTFTDLDKQVYTFTVPAGQAFVITQDNDDDHDHNFWLQDANGVELFYESYYYDSTYSSASQDAWVYWYAATETTYRAVLEAEDTAANQVLTVETFTPNNLGTIQPGGTVAHADTDGIVDEQSDMHVIEVTTESWLTVESKTPADEDIDLYFYDSQMNEVNNATASGADTMGGLALSPGIYVLRVEAYEMAPSYDLNISAIAPLGAPQFSSTVGQIIPDADTSNPLTDTLTVTGCTTIDSVSVYVDITHPDSSELDIEITSPDGTVVQIFNNENYTDEDLVGWFPHIYESDEPLSALNGETGDGDWMISIVDNYSSDPTGPLNSWGLTLTCQ